MARCSITTVLAFIWRLALLLPTDEATVDDYMLTGQLALVGWANNHFAARGTAYSDEGPEALEYNPFTHTWSLGVEEQFYFLFPTLVALAYGRRAVVRPCAAMLAQWRERSVAARSGAKGSESGGRR